MQVTLDKAGKRFDRQWVFRNINHTFTENSKTAVLGSNGAGKSSLFKIIAGFTNLTEGNISYSLGSKTLSSQEIFSNVSLISPHLELIEEFSLSEFLRFHFSMRQILPGLKPEKVIDLTKLGSNSKKPIRYFSSGMKQRVKIAVCLFSSSNMLLLDEPCTNLDYEGRKWFKDCLSEYSNNRTTIVFSNNNNDETFACKSSIILE